MSTDFSVVNVPAMLAQKVTITDQSGTRDDPDWNREAAESQFVFAEFLSEKGLLHEGISVSRHPDLTIRWMQLNERGQEFTRAHFDKWLVSVDKTGTTETAKRQKLEKRWIKFNAQ